MLSLLFVTKQTTRIHVTTSCKQNVFGINFGAHLFVVTVFSLLSTNTNKPLFSSRCHVHFKQARSNDKKPTRRDACFPSMSEEDYCACNGSQRGTSQRETDNRKTPDSLCTISAGTHALQLGMYTSYMVASS